jgi:hypothetical protein
VSSRLSTIQALQVAAVIRRTEPWVEVRVQTVAVPAGTVPLLALAAVVAAAVPGWAVSVEMAIS